MIVEYSSTLNEWVIRDRGRGYRINADVAQLAYRDYVDRFRREQLHHTAFVPIDKPTLTEPPRVWTMEEFLELVAIDAWERGRMKPLNHPRLDCIDWSAMKC